MKTSSEQRNGVVTPACFHLAKTTSSMRPWGETVAPLSNGWIGPRGVVSAPAAVANRTMAESARVAICFPSRENKDVPTAYLVVVTRLYPTEAPKYRA